MRFLLYSMYRVYLFKVDSVKIIISVKLHGSKEEKQEKKGVVNPSFTCVAYIRNSIILGICCTRPIPQNK